MPQDPSEPADLSDIELLRAECLRLQDEVAKLRAKQFVMMGAPVFDEAPDNSATALQARRMGRILMLERENDTLKHRLRVEEARARTLMVDAARRVGDDAFRAAALGADGGMTAVNTADLMLLLCAVPPAPVIIEVEAPQNSEAGLEPPQQRDDGG